MVVDSCRIMTFPIFLLLLSAAFVRQGMAEKALVILDDPLIQGTHSLYFGDLISRGYEISFKSASDRKLQLKDWDEWLFDKIILFAPSASGRQICSGRRVCGKLRHFWRDGTAAHLSFWIVRALQGILNISCRYHCNSLASTRLSPM